MNNRKIGELLRTLRTQSGLTQNEAAQKLNVSDKTVSKWERGLGCPDVSLLTQLSRLYQVDVETLLSGTQKKNRTLGGNMKRIKFYHCPVCGNVLTSTATACISCCGTKLDEWKPQEANAEHSLRFENVEDEYFITLNHEMKKQHYISFIAYANSDRVLMIKLYPEQNPQTRFPKMYGGRFYFACSEHGLFQQKNP